MTRSAFGVEHGGISKRTDRLAERQQTEERKDRSKKFRESVTFAEPKGLSGPKKPQIKPTKPFKPLDLIKPTPTKTKPVIKSYTKIAGRLAQAAEGGSEYARARISAGNKGQAVAQNLKISRAPIPKGMMNQGKARKQRQAAKTATILGASNKFSGGQQAQRAKNMIPPKTSGGIGRMENQASERIASNQSRQRMKRGLIGAGAVGGVGAVGAGGYAYGRKK